MGCRQLYQFSLALARAPRPSTYICVRVPSSRILVRLPDGKRLTRRFPVAAPLSALVDYVCVQLAESGATSPTSQWQLVSQHPPLKLAFAPDASADAAALEQTFSAIGLAPSAQLHVAPLLA